MKKRKSFFRRLLLVVFVVAVVAAIYVALQPRPISVDVVELTEGPLIVTVEEDGRTRIKERYVVSAPLSGRLLRVELNPGDEVEQQTTRLAAIVPSDPAMLDARELKQAEMRVKAQAAAVEQAEDLVGRAEATLDYALSDLNRVEKLMPQRVTTRDDMDRAKKDYRIAEEDMQHAVHSQLIAKFELELARAALIRTQNGGNSDYSDFEIFAPVGGRVLHVFQESSTVVSPGMRLIEVGDPSDLEVVVDVLSSDAVKIPDNASVLLERWGGDQPLQGTVRLVEPSAFTKISALGVEEQRVNVIIDLIDPQHKRKSLGDGFRVEARIVIWEHPRVVKIPSGALFRDGGQWAAFAVQEGRASLRHVQLGKQNDLEAQVLAGLSANDWVILHPSDKIQNGARIQPRSVRL